MAQVLEIRNPVYSLAPKTTSLRTVKFPTFTSESTFRLALINNEKPGAWHFVQLIKQYLFENFPNIEIRHFAKGNEQTPVSSALSDEVRDFADVAIFTTCD